MELKTKPYGTVYAVLKTPDQIANRKKIEETEYFRFRLHGANVRARELGESYTARSINVKYTHHLKSIEGIVPESDIGIYAKVPFFDLLKNAQECHEKALKKNPDAVLLTIPVVTNMTKNERG